MKKEILTNLIHPEIRKMITRSTATKISQRPKIFHPTKETADSLFHMKNQAPQENKIMITGLILNLPMNLLRQALLDREAPSEQFIDKPFRATGSLRQTVNMIPPIDTRCQIQKFTAQLKRIGTQKQQKILLLVIYRMKNFTKESKRYSNDDSTLILQEINPNNKMLYASIHSFLHLLFSFSFFSFCIHQFAWFFKLISIKRA